MLTVTKRFEFCYGHFLPEYNGPCISQHGHNAILFVEVKRGSLSQRYLNYDYPGMVCDFSILKKAVKENILDVLDHKNINDLEPVEKRDNFLSPCCNKTRLSWNKMIKHPTAENMVLWIKEVLSLYFDLVRIRLYETPNSYAEWKM